MSDYFGALLRSAGTLPANTGTREVSAAADDWVVELEVEADAAVPAPAAASPQARAEMEPTPRPQADSSPAPNVEPREAARSEPAAAPRKTRPAPAGDVHPVVRAALEWVAADPVSQSPAVMEAAEAPAASDLSPRTVVSPITAPARSTRAQPVPLSTRVAPDIEPAAERPAAPLRPSPAHGFELTLPQAAHKRQQTIALAAPPAAISPERIEVSIGTIHVAIDAPPAPRPQPQPAPPPPRPQAAAAAPRSGFARSRLPRF